MIHVRIGLCAVKMDSCCAADLNGLDVGWRLVWGWGSLGNTTGHRSARPDREGLWISHLTLYGRTVCLLLELLLLLLLLLLIHG